MTSWPWMQGVDVAIADPVDPVCPEDVRPSVKDLLQQHAEAIATIKSSISDHSLYDASKHDDLWIVRFYLSHKKTKPAIEAAKKTLEYRAKFKLDEKDIRQTPPHRATQGEIFEFISRTEPGTLIATHPNPDRGVLFFLRPAGFNMHKLVQELTEAHWLPTFSYITEWSHQHLDYVTRTTGRLTKSVRFINMEGMKLSLFNRECMKRNGNAIGAMEDFYPQLLESVFICDPPALVKGLWNVFRAILPKRLLEKIDIINPKKSKKERDRLHKHISDKDLPVVFGGQNQVPIQEWESA